MTLITLYSLLNRSSTHDPISKLWSDIRTESKWHHHIHLFFLILAFLFYSATSGLFKNVLKGDASNLAGHWIALNRMCIWCNGLQYLTLAMAACMLLESCGKYFISSFIPSEGNTFLLHVYHRIIELIRLKRPERSSVQPQPNHTTLILRTLHYIISWMLPRFCHMFLFYFIHFFP